VVNEKKFLKNSKIHEIMTAILSSRLENFTGMGRRKVQKAHDQEETIDEIR
jgi:hypothetical protein